MTEYQSFRDKPARQFLEDLRSGNLTMGEMGYWKNYLVGSALRFTGGVYALVGAFNRDGEAVMAGLAAYGAGKAFSGVNELRQDIREVRGGRGADGIERLFRPAEPESQ